MDSNPPTAADYAASDAREAMARIRRLEKRLDELEEWTGRIAKSVRMLCEFLKTVPNPPKNNHPGDS